MAHDCHSDSIPSPPLRAKKDTYKHHKLNHWLVNVGPTSNTLSKHQNSIEFSSRIFQGVGERSIFVFISRCCTMCEEWAREHPYSRARYDISQASDWSRWPSRPIRGLRYIVTCTRIRESTLGAHNQTLMLQSKAVPWLLMYGFLHVVSSSNINVVLFNEVIHINNWRNISFFNC